MNPFALKLVAGLGAVLLILLVVADRNRLRSDLKVANGRLDAHCELVRQIAENPKMKCRDSEKQLAASVQTMRDFRTTAKRVIDSVNRLQQHAQRLTSLANQAAKINAPRAAAARRASDALTASARSPDRRTKPCEPSDELKRRWK